MPLKYVVPQLILLLKPQVGSSQQQQMSVGGFERAGKTGSGDGREPTTSRYSIV